MDTVMCTLFMKALVRSNSVSKAMAVYEEMKSHEGGHPDIVTFSVLIKALVDQHDLQPALQLLDDLRKAGLAPDDIILTHLLEGCRHAADLDLGKKLFTDLVNAGVKPSEFTLVTMLKLHGRCGANAEAYEMVSTWQEKHGVKPSVIHYTCMMSGCLRSKQYDHAWAAYELMCHRGIHHDETVISTLLPGLITAQQWGRVVCMVRKLLTPPVQCKVPSGTLNLALSQMWAVGGCRRQGDQLHELMLEGGVHVTARNVNGS
jgi:pentatricopeptide repeat protein